MKRSVLAGTTAASILPAVAAAQGDGAASMPIEQVTSFMTGFSPLQYAAAELAVVALVGVALVALRNGWGGHALGHARGGIVFSLLVGIPATLALGGILFVGVVFMTNEFGTVLGVPILGVVGSLTLVWHAIGFVAIGTWFTATIGIETPYPGVVLGALLAAGTVTLVALSPIAGGLPLIVVSALGIGSGVRASYGRYTVDPSERQIPPKHQHIKR